MATIIGRALRWAARTSWVALAVIGCMVFVPTSWLVKPLQFQIEGNKPFLQRWRSPDYPGDIYVQAVPEVRKTGSLHTCTSTRVLPIELGPQGQAVHTVTGPLANFMAGCTEPGEYFYTLQFRYRAFGFLPLRPVTYSTRVRID
ncbi:MAG: hypothetical protein AAGC92_16435 [Pseudomonadota bacterium]